MPHDLTGEWSDAEAEAWRVLHNAQEGDRVLFGDRSVPLTVSDVGTKQDGRQYINVNGPNGGGPYHITEEYGDDGHPTYHTQDRWEDASTLRFVERWFETEDSEAAGRVGPTEADELIHETVSNARAAAAQHDSTFGEQMRPVAADTVEMVSDPEVRGLLYHSDHSDVTDVSDPTFIEPDRDHARGTLVREMRALQNSTTPEDTPAWGATHEPEIGTAEDYERLVDSVATTVNSFTDDGGPHADGHLEAATQTALDGMAPADWAQVVAHGSGVDTLPILDDENDLYQVAVGTLQQAVDDELQQRREERMEAAETTVMDADQYVTELAGTTLSWDDLMEAWGTSLAGARDTYKEQVGRLPVMADGGQPHTLVDEATQLYGEEVVQQYNDWRLDDPGIVGDDDTRKMAWLNDATGEMLALVGWAEQAGGTDRLPDLDKWTVWYYDPDADEVEPVFSTAGFEEAHDVAKEFITGGSRPDFEVAADGSGTQTVVRDNLDHEEVGRQFLADSGWTVLGQSIPVPTRDVPKAAGDGLFKTVGLLGRAGKAAGKAAGRSALRGGEKAGAYVWHTFRERIAKAVGWILLFLAARGLAVFKDKTRFSFDWGAEKAGFDVGTYWAPDDAPDDAKVDADFSAEMNKRTLMERFLGGEGERLTWLLGVTDSQAEELFERLARYRKDFGVMLGDEEDLSDREQGRWGETRQARDPKSGDDDNDDGGSGGVSTSGGSDDGPSSPYAWSTETNGGRTVGGSAPDGGGVVSTENTTEEMLSSFSARTGGDAGTDPHPTGSSTESTESSGTTAAGVDLSDEEADVLRGAITEEFDDVGAADDEPVDPGRGPPPEPEPEFMGRAPGDEGALDAQREDLDEAVANDAARNVATSAEEEMVLSDINGTDRAELMEFYDEDDLTGEERADTSYAAKLLTEGREDEFQQFVDQPSTAVDLGFLDELDAQLNANIAGLGGGGISSTSAPADDRTREPDGGWETDYELSQYEDWEDDDWMDDWEGDWSGR